MSQVKVILTLNLQEFKFFTISSFPAGFLQSIGGIVSARSVKLLDKIDNPGTNLFIGVSVITYTLRSKICFKC